MTDSSPDPARAPEPPRRRKHRRVVRQGTEREHVEGVTEDERGGHGDNDDRLLRDLPPHWGRR